MPSQSNWCCQRAIPNFKSLYGHPLLEMMKFQLLSCRMKLFVACTTQLQLRCFEKSVFFSGFKKEFFRKTVVNLVIT